MRLTNALLALVAYVALPVVPTALVSILNGGAPSDIVVPDRYIVRYKPDADVQQKQRHEADVDKTARDAKKLGIVDKFDLPGLEGYVVEMPSSEMDILKACKLIDYIEKDTIVKKDAPLTPSPHHFRVPNIKRTMRDQPDAPWGLARISHSAPNGGGQTDYYYSDSAGQGVRVYVIDTGIRITHSEFSTSSGDSNTDPANHSHSSPKSKYKAKTGHAADPKPNSNSHPTRRQQQQPSRAVWGANFVPHSPDADDDGHGTHVAGIIAGSTYGVAKLATVVAVKVLDDTGTGSMSGLLQGLNWAVSDAKAKGVAARAVVNLSLSGAYTQSVNDGVKAATDAGVTVVVAAGNDNANASSCSPASAGSAVTVGALGEGDDSRAGFSNWGVAVDLFAPGVDVPSAWNASDEAHAVLSGTSMAAPHVAGLAAYFIARENLSGSAAVVKRILGAANAGVGDGKGSADRIAYNDDGV